MGSPEQGVTPPMRFTFDEVSTLLGLVVDDIKDEPADTERWSDLNKLRTLFAGLLAAEFERIATPAPEAPTDD